MIIALIYAIWNMTNLTNFFFFFFNEAYGFHKCKDTNRCLVYGHHKLSVIKDSSTHNAEFVFFLKKY